MYQKYCAVTPKICKLTHRCKKYICVIIIVFFCLCVCVYLRVNYLCVIVRVFAYLFASVCSYVCVSVPFISDCV